MGADFLAWTLVVAQSAGEYFSLPETDVLTSIYRYYLPEPHASLLSGILFGEELETSEHFYHAVKITGLLHIVVLSGMNITLLGALIGIFTKGFGRKISAILTISGIVIFVMFVGADPPVTRAAVMGVLTLIAIVMERKALAMYILFLSAGLIALVKTEWLTSVSFQLSFGATLGIMLFGSVPQRIPHAPATSGAPPASSALRTSIAPATSSDRSVTHAQLPPDAKPKLMRKWFGYLEQELRPSFAAQMFTVPIIMWYFRELSVIAPLANLLVSFAIPPLMIFGLVLAIIGKLNTALGWIPAYICYGLLHYIIMVIEMLGQLPYIFFSFADG